MASPFGSPISRRSTSSSFTFPEYTSPDVSVRIPEDSPATGASYGGSEECTPLARFPGEIEGIIKNKLLPEIILDQLNTLQPPKGTPNYRASSYLIQEADQLEQCARLIYDAWIKAHETKNGEDAGFVYLPGHYVIDTQDDRLAKTFSVEKITLVVKDRMDDLYLVLSKRGRVTPSFGSQKVVTPMWLIPLTRKEKWRKCVFIQQPKFQGGIELPSLQDEVQVITQLFHACGHGKKLHTPFLYFSANLPKKEGTELSPFSCAIQEELQFLDKVLPPGIERRLIALRGAAEALEELHSKGYIHGDVQRSNMCNKEGGLIDFGEKHQYKKTTDGTEIHLAKKIGHLDFNVRAPEEQLFFWLMRERLDPTFRMEESNREKYITGIKNEKNVLIIEPLVPIEVQESIQKDIAKFLPLCEGESGEERLENITFYVGPPQDIYQLGMATNDLLSGLIGLKPEKYEALQNFIDSMISPFPQKRPTAEETVKQFTHHIEIEKERASGGTAGAGGSSA